MKLNASLAPAKTMGGPDGELLAANLDGRVVIDPAVGRDIDALKVGASDLQGRAGVPAAGGFGLSGKDIAISTIPPTGLTPSAETAFGR
ncbi:MAG: hypothetical protein AB4040_10210 [Synechococcus sp.]